MKIGDRIKQLCRCKGITHKKLAEEAGITEPSISLIVNNKREPRARSIVAISDALGVSTDYLLKGQEHE